MEPQLTDTAFISFDGSELPLQTWLPSGSPRAVMIALHGYNDYANFIRDAAVWFSDRGIGVYAYDQRGFGRAPHRGKWAGQSAMCRDLRIIIKLVRKRHPHVPLYLLGDSMGGAVVMVADTPENPLRVDGVILVAPAVWSRATMPFYQRCALWLGARLVPWLQLTGEGLHVTPSDNKEMLKALGRDPLVIKESRIDAICGLVNLMDAAYEAAARFNSKVLFLYGAKDEIIPPKPMEDVFEKRLHEHFSSPQRLLVYANGYHMLLRDLQAKVVWNDILCWLSSLDETFPSVREKAAHEITRDGEMKAFMHPASMI
ncbi:MAG: lysophospholipase [Proteobacteria bacterium]|nr:lysophospholipase [Pseudomonadota bacterium]MBU4294465.1 lysophospholipase [Pseudomonadota bacterium]MCG2749172.1 lysophospholipase [Desulfobulbaceae bacterium]